MITHRHDYTRLRAALNDELGGLSTSLGLSASPSLILSTESVVEMEWKGTSTSRARRLLRRQQEVKCKRKPGTARSHELGWSSDSDPRAHG